MAEEKKGEVRTQSHSDGANDARTEHGALSLHEYGLLAPEELTGDPAATGPQGSGDSPKDTTGTGVTDRRETGTRERNGQRAILASGQREDKEQEQGTPERQPPLMYAFTRGRRWGDPPLRSLRFLRTARGWRETPLPGNWLLQPASRGQRRGEHPTISNT